MKLVIEVDLIGSEGGSPDPAMAALVVGAVIHWLDATQAIQEAIKHVEQETRSSIPLGRRDVRIDRSSATVYGIKE